MARQANTRVQVASSDRALSRGVYAQVTGSSLKAAKIGQQAAALQGAFGLAAELQKGKEAKDLAAGTLAAEQGQVDEATLRKQKRSAQWVLGAERVIGRSRAIEDEAAMKEWYVTEFDKTQDMSVLREGLNSWMADRYDGSDPGIGREAAPFLSRGAETILQAHGTALTEESQAKVRTGLSQSTNEFLTRGEITQESWDERRAEYTNLYPTQEAGLQALAKDVAASIELNGDETIIDNPMFEKLKTNPATRDIIDRAMTVGRTARTNAWKQDHQIATAEFKAEVDAAAARNDQNSFMELLIQGTTPNEQGVILLSQAETDSAVSNFYKANQENQLESINVGNFFAGNGKVANKDLDKTYDAAEEILRAQGMSEDEIVRTLITGMTVGGHLPTKISEMFDNVSPANPDGMREAYAYYSQMKAVSPTAPFDMMNDKQRKQMEAYEAISRDHDPAETAEIMKTHDRTLITEYSPSDIRDAAESVLSHTVDIPWAWNDMEDNATVKRFVTERLTYFAGFPGTTLEEAMELAINDVDQRFQYVGGSLYPDTSPWGADGEKAAELYLKEQEDFHDTPYEITPVPGDPTRVWVGPTDRMFGESNNKVLIEDLTNHYEGVQFQRIQEEAALQNRKETQAVTEEAKKRAAPNLIPRADFAGARLPQEYKDLLSKKRDAAWNALTETERSAYFEQIREEHRVDAAIREEKNRAGRELALKIGLSKPGIL